MLNATSGHPPAKRLALTLVALLSATPFSAAEPSAEGPRYRTDENILYRDGTELTDSVKERCRLDVYYPVETRDFATVVWFHGGGLKAGNRFVPKELQGKGIAVVAAGYRLSPDVKAPAWIEDAAAAVAWTFRNIAKYGGSTRRIFVSGHSAGGYLTSMVGLDKRWLAAHGLDADTIAGLIPFSGHCITHFTVRAERGIPGTQAVVDDLAPLFHVRQDAPPLLLITGDRDREMLGRYEENAYLWRMMKEVAHPDTELFELEGYNHGGMAQPAHPLLLRFIKEHSRATSGSADSPNPSAPAPEPAPTLDPSAKPLSENEELQAFLEARLVPKLGNAWDYTFAPGAFPAIGWDHPEAVAKVMGTFPIKVWWFDGAGREVTVAEGPGRYAFYGEGTTAGGKVIRRGGTLFCRPKEWDGWSERLSADLSFVPLDGLTRSAWDEHRKAIAGFAGRTVLRSILRQQEGAVLMSYLQELQSTGASPSPLDTPVIADLEYHLALKRRRLGIENKFRSLQPPRRTAREGATTLRPGTDVEAGFKAGTTARLREIALGWFEQSGEPFNLVVARRGVVILDDSFGNWSWGEMTRETPTEMASITKLITGVLFAQFVDQGQIGLDDPVGKYFPDFPVTGDNVLTLRHCFTHATALYGHEEWGGMHNPWLENLIANVAEHLRPGQVHNYNGMGYDLAGKIMELVSGKSVFRLTRENLFEPLGMTRTTLEEDLGFSCFSTAADMAKLGQMLLNRGAYGDQVFFSPQTFKRILPQPLNRFYPALDQDWGIGLTWMRHAHPDAGKETLPAEATLLSRNTIGHGSATAAILRVDLDNELVVTQSRRRGGRDYDKNLTRLLLAIQEGLETG